VVSSLDSDFGSDIAGRSNSPANGEDSTKEYKSMDQSTDSHRQLN
jgi:hypothetical protein